MTLQWRFDNLSGSDHQSLIVTSAQVVETSVSVITNGPSSSHLEYRAAGHMLYISMELAPLNTAFKVSICKRLKG